MKTIGIDLGTSAVKILLVDEQGQAAKTISREYPLSFPHPGWSEQNPSDWMEAIYDGLDELFSDPDLDPRTIGGIGVAGQMHGLVVLDENDFVLRPCILWNDGRTVKENDFLNNTVGQDVLKENTGNISFAGFTAPKLLWMKENEPELYTRISKIMLPKDYVNYILTGKHVTDYSDAAGTLLLDVKNKKWSNKMLEICEIDISQLPELHESYEAIGTLKPEIAKRYNLPDDVKVAAGAGDNAGAAIGCDITGPGKCVISLGTSGTIFLTSDEFPEGDNRAIHCFNHADGKWHLMGCILSAASCNKWWMDEILKTTEYSREQEEISRDHLGRNDVYFLPYLMGERSPHNDAKVRSCLIGMSMDTKREDITQAVLEGVAFAFRDCLEIAKEQGVEVKESMVCGGGSKSPLWLEILANVLNIPLNIPMTEQGPGYGGALLAMKAAGDDREISQIADDFVKIRSTVYPDEKLSQLYEDRYQHYAKVYPAIKDLF